MSNTRLSDIGVLNVSAQMMCTLDNQLFRREFALHTTIGLVNR